MKACVHWTAHVNANDIVVLTRLWVVNVNPMIGVHFQPLLADFGKFRGFELLIATGALVCSIYIVFGSVQHVDHVKLYMDV